MSRTNFVKVSNLPPYLQTAVELHSVFSTCGVIQVGIVPRYQISWRNTYFPGYHRSRPHHRDSLLLYEVFRRLRRVCLKHRCHYRRFPLITIKFKCFTEVSQVPPCRSRDISQPQILSSSTTRPTAGWDSLLARSVSQSVSPSVLHFHWSSPTLCHKEPALGKKLPIGSFRSKYLLDFWMSERSWFFMA